MDSRFEAHSSFKVLWLLFTILNNPPYLDSLQVLPLVEAFFVVCGLQDALPPPLPTHTTSTITQGASADLAAASAAARIISSSSGAIAGWQQHQRASVTGSVTSTVAAMEEKYGPFQRFCERHKRLLNAYVRRSLPLLEGSLAPLMRVPRLIEFDNKRAYFRWVRGRREGEMVFCVDCHKVGC